MWSGNLWISKGFSDSKNMLICGVLDPDAPPRPRLAAPGTTSMPQTTGLKRGHRNHHRPLAAPAMPPAVYSCTEFRKTDEMKVIGAARVIFKEERVAPLFIAQPSSSTDSFSAHPQVRAAIRGGSKGQVYIPETGEVVWDCWEETSYSKARCLKRRVVAKERKQERQSLRLLKCTEQEAFGA